MNIDELTNKIREVSSDKIIQELADFIQQWKADEKNAIELKENVERYLGNTWIDKEADFKKVHGMWSDFIDSAINGIGGMTMNERLHWFGMLEMYENAKSSIERQKIYKKLMA
jgi:hypothetical protein